MSNINWLAFDLEISKVVPEGQYFKSLLEHKPLGISVAATLERGDEPLAWHDSALGSTMQLPELYRLAGYLWEMYDRDYLIITWNGVNFDFNVLVDEIERAEVALVAAGGDAPTEEGIIPQIKEMALKHCDMGFQMVCEKGYMCALHKAATGMGLPGKPEGMYGALAPVLWQQGFDQKQEVIEYCKQDVRVTGSVFDVIVERGHLSWISRSGNRQLYWPKMATRQSDGAKRMLLVEEANKLPTPDTSWMGPDRPQRADYIDWLFK